MTPYQHLKRAAADVGWPERFKSDLTRHDRARLRGSDAPKAFGWVLRSTGTELIDPRIDEETLAGFLADYALNGACHLYFWFDGCMLHSLSFEHWSVILQQENAPSGEQRHCAY